MPKPLPDDVRAALIGGHKIEAIRLLRERTGLGLVAAKAAVEAGLVPDDAEIATNFAALPPEVAAALASGHKVQAVKLLREIRRLDLKQAKSVVDDASRRARDTATRQAAGLSPGEMPRTGRSAGFVIFLMAVVGFLVWLVAFRG